MASGEHILVDWIRFVVFGSDNPRKDDVSGAFL
jgi:hypothetical protein